MDQLSLDFRLVRTGVEMDVMDEAMPAGAMNPVQQPFAPPATLAEVMQRIAADPNITSNQRRDRLSALRAVVRLGNRDARLIQATPPAIRNLLAAVRATGCHLSPSRLSAICSRTLAAFCQVGIPLLLGRSSTRLAPEWQHLFARLPGKHEQAGLGRLMRFCSRVGIKPDQADDAAFDRFRVALDEDSVAKSRHQVHRKACSIWNRMVRTVPEWPRHLVTIPANPRLYSLAWTDFPASFVSDLEAFLARCGQSDPFSDDYARATRPGTIDLRRRQLRQMASLLAASGVAIEQVTSLAVLVATRHAEIILRAAHARLGKGSTHLHGMAMLLRTVAAHWVRAPADVIEQLGTWMRNLSPPARGMTPKNRGRLQQFEDPENLRRLLMLPRRIFEVLGRRQNLDRSDAVQALFALATELLTAMPMRLSNLLALDLDRHLVVTGRGSSRVIHVAIPGAETKTGEAYEVTVPPETARMIETYRSRYLPLISPVPTTLLFPNQTGGCRESTTFSSSLSRFLRREIGLAMHPHLFRHLAVTVFLARHPEDLETARRLLGHRSLTTTLKYYASIKTDACLKRFDAVMAEARDGSMPAQRSRRSTRRGGQ